MASNNSQSATDLLKSGMSRQDIRKQIIGQRKGTFVRAAEREQAKKFREVSEGFTNVEQFEKAYGSVSKNVSRRLEGIEAVKKSQAERISQTEKEIKDAEQREKSEIQNLQKKIEKARSRGDSEDVDEYEDRIEERRAYWGEYRRGLQQGQTELKKGNIIQVDKIKGFARDNANIAESNRENRNDFNKQQREQAKALGFGSVNEYKKALPTLKKLQKGDVTQEEASMLPDRLREQIKFEEIPPESKTSVTSRVKGGITFFNPFTKEIVTAKDSPGPLWNEVSSQQAELIDKLQSPREVKYKVDKSLFPDIPKDIERAKFGTKGQEELMSDMALYPETGNFFTEDTRRINIMNTNIKKNIDVYKGEIDSLNKIDSEIRDFTSGKIDENSNTWKGTEEDYKKYQELVKKRSKQEEKVKIQKERLNSLSVRIDEFGNVIEPKVSLLGEDISLSSFEGLGSGDFLESISGGTKALIKTSGVIGKKIGEKGGQVIGKSIDLIDEKILGLDKGESLFTIPEYEKTIYEPQFGTVQIDPSTGEMFKGERKINVDEKEMFKREEDAVKSASEIGGKIGQVIGESAPFVAAGYAGGAVAGTAGIIAADWGLYGALRGAEYRDIIQEQGFKEGTKEFSLKYPLEVGGLVLGTAIVGGSAIKRSLNKPIITFEDIPVSQKFAEPLAIKSKPSKIIQSGGKSSIFREVNIFDDITQSGSKTRVTTPFRRFIGMDEIYSGVPYRNLNEYNKALNLLEKAGYSNSQAKNILRLRKPTAIDVVFKGEDILTTSDDISESIIKGTRVSSPRTIDVDGVKLKGGKGSFEIIEASTTPTGKSTASGQEIFRTSTELNRFRLTNEGAPFSKLDDVGRTRFLEKSFSYSEDLGETIIPKSFQNKIMVGTSGDAFEVKSISQQTLPLKRGASVGKSNLLIERGAPDLIIDLDELAGTTTTKFIKGSGRRSSQQFLNNMYKLDTVSLPKTTEIKIPTNKRITGGTISELSEIKSVPSTSRVAVSVKTNGEVIQNLEEAEVSLIKPAMKNVQRERFKEKEIPKEISRGLQISRTKIKDITDSLELTKSKTSQRELTKLQTSQGTKQINQFELLSSPAAKIGRVRLPPELDNLPKRPPIVFLKGKTKPRPIKRKRNDEFLEPEVLPQGFTAAQVGLRRRITSKQASRLAKNPNAFGLRAAYEIVDKKENIKKKKKVVKRKKKRNSKPSKRYELTGLEFEIPA